MPFKKEYFDNDPIINEIFQDNYPIRNRVINNRRNESEYQQGNIIIDVNTENNNINNQRRVRRRINTIINNNNLKEQLFIQSENPNFILSLIVILFNISVVGLGTCIMGCKTKSCFYVFFRNISNL